MGNAIRLFGGQAHRRIHQRTHALAPTRNRRHNTVGVPLRVLILPNNLQQLIRHDLLVFAVHDVVQRLPRARIRQHPPFQPHPFLPDRRLHFTPYPRVQNPFLESHPPLFGGYNADLIRHLLLSLPKKSPNRLRHNSGRHPQYGNQYVLLHAPLVPHSTPLGKSFPPFYPKN